jgi:hypothetical protein
MGKQKRGTVDYRQSYGTNGPSEAEQLAINETGSLIIHLLRTGMSLTGLPEYKWVKYDWRRSNLLIIRIQCEHPTDWHAARRRAMSTWEDVRRKAHNERLAWEVEENPALWLPEPLPNQIP